MMKALEDLIPAIENLGWASCEVYLADKLNHYREDLRDDLAERHELHKEGADEEVARAPYLTAEELAAAPNFKTTLPLASVISTCAPKLSDAPAASSVSTKCMTAARFTVRVFAITG